MLDIRYLYLLFSFYFIIYLYFHSIRGLSVANWRSDRIPTPKTTIPNPQSPIPNPQSPITSTEAYQME